MADGRRAHWGRVIGLAAGVVVAAFVAPRFVPGPDLDENRRLAGPPSLGDIDDLAAFRRRADAYVADRFPPRAQLIGALNRVRLLVGVSGSPRVIVGRRGWLFSDDGSHLGPARGAPPLGDAAAAAWLGGLAGRTEALEAQGIAYLVLVPPVKEAVYPGLAPGWFVLDPNRPAAALARLARASDAGDMLYLHPALAAAAHRGVKTYSAHDTHWTGLGAYYGYAALMNELARRGLAEGPRPIEAFREVRADNPNKPRNLALMLGVASFVDVDYPELDDPPAELETTVTWLTGRRDWTAPRVVDTGRAGKPVLLMTLDSFSNALLPFLYAHFSRIVLAHNQDGAWRPDLIARFHPDIVITEVLESGAPAIMAGSPAPSPAALARIRTAVAERRRDEVEPLDPAHKGPRTLRGTDGPDRLIGGWGGQVIQGLKGDDTIEARGGDDEVHAGRGNDSVDGGDGDDWLSGDRGDDTVSGGRGADTFASSAGAGLDLVLDFSVAQGDAVVFAPGTRGTVRQDGSDTVIRMSGGRVVLRGVQASQIPRSRLRNLQPP